VLAYSANKDIPLNESPPAEKTFEEAVPVAEGRKYI
jgi:hypothetical protein